MKNAIGIGVALALVTASACASAQDAWPARTVKFVVPSSPGGGTDAYARLLAHSLGETFKQQFIVDNRPGASGNVGAEIAAKATPDGYTFLVSASPALIINPSLYKNLPYNAERDFAPVARGVINPLIFCVHPSVPARTLADLAALGKREPGKLAYGSAGSGSATNLGVRMLEEASGAKFLHVPYKGLGQAYQGLLSGAVQFMLSDVVTVLSHIRTGRIVPLATTHRMKLLPDTPTITEAGYPNIDAYATFSVVAPAGTPSAIIQRMSVEINKAMKSPALAEKLEAQALLPVFDTPAEYAATLKKERERWAVFIRRTGLAPD